jgi:acetyltransferase-like isoleucine patch superfamily enzyme
MQVGKYTYGHNAITVKTWLGQSEELVIGKHCSIAVGLTVMLGGNHRHEWISTYPFGHVDSDFVRDITNVPAAKSNGDVIIGNDVWIGQGATIMSGINIGDGAVIAANSHVVKDIPPYSIFGGNPAVLIKKRFDDNIIELLLTLRWWDLSVDQIREIQPILCSQPTYDIVRELVVKYRS